MIDYEKLSYWIGCQLDDLKDAYNETPSDGLYCAMKAYKAMDSQLNLVWALQGHQPSDEPAQGLSSCCSVHAGTTEECKEEIKETFCCGQKLFYTSVPWSEPRCGKCGRNLDAQTNQDEVDLDGCQHDFIPFSGALALDNCKKCGKSVYSEECQHESNGINYTNQFYEAHKNNYVVNKCKKCGEFYR